MALILMCKFNYAYNYIVFMHYLLYFSRNLFSFSQYKNIKKNVPWHNFLLYKKECALAHSRAEARLLRQPYTPAPSALLRSTAVGA